MSHGPYEFVEVILAIITGTSVYLSAINVYSEKV
jgi:hypothetical protein